MNRNPKSVICIGAVVVIGLAIGFYALVRGDVAPSPDPGRMPGGIDASVTPDRSPASTSLRPDDPSNSTPDVTVDSGTGPTRRDNHPVFVLEDEDTESPGSGGAILVARSNSERVKAPMEVFVSGHAEWPYAIDEIALTPTLPEGMTLEGSAMTRLDEFCIFRSKNGRCFVPRRGRDQCSVCVLVEGFELLSLSRVQLAPPGQKPNLLNLDLVPIGAGGVRGRVLSANGSVPPQITVVWTAQMIFGEERLWSRPGAQFRNPGNQLAANLRVRGSPNPTGEFHLAPCLPSRVGRLCVFQGDLLVYAESNIETKSGESTILDPIVIGSFRTVEIRVTAPGYTFPNFLIFAEGCPSHTESSIRPATHGTSVSYGRGAVVIPLFMDRPAKLTPMVDTLYGPKAIRSDRDGKARGFIQDATKLANRFLATAARGVERGELFAEDVELKLSQDKLLEVLRDPANRGILSALQSALSQELHIDEAVIDGVRQAVEQERPWPLLRVLLGS